MKRSIEGGEAWLRVVSKGLNVEHRQVQQPVHLVPTQEYKHMPPHMRGAVNLNVVVFCEEFWDPGPIKEEAHKQGTKSLQELPKEQRELLGRRKYARPRQPQ